MLSIPFANGEQICTLEQFLKRAAKKPATKLILDIKNQSTPQRETELVKSVLSAVKSAGMEANVEYIADHPWTCFELAKYAPEQSKVHYLNGGYNPQYVKAMGCDGIDYPLGKLKKNKKWIKQAQKLGLTVNVWTVDKEADIRWCIQNGVDIITTNNPALVKSIIKEMCK
jgi:glycerophosphoryl diester phosphodiesterase